MFLLPDGLCRIHKELGFDAKPLICRMFPLQVVPRDGVAMLTIRRACPSAAADKGRPVAEQLEFAKKLARERGLTDSRPEPPPLKPGEPRGWPPTRRLLDTLHRLLVDERFPPRAAAGARADLLPPAGAGENRPARRRKAGRFADVLESSVPDEVGDLFSKRHPPSPRGQRALSADRRRICPPAPALSCAALVEPAAATRLGRVETGPRPRRTAALHPQFPAATFEQLEQPLGRLDASLYQPLTGSSRRRPSRGVMPWPIAAAGR